MKKVIFLDVDGVLNTRQSKGERVNVIEEKVKVLADIVHATSATVVLTSTWRHNITKKLFGGYKGENVDTQQLLALFQKYKIKRFKIFEGITNENNGLNRAGRIEKFLKDNKIERFVILDDEDFGFSKFCHNGEFIKTEFFGDNDNAGLLSSMKEDIIRKLNK